MSATFPDELPAGVTVVTPTRRLAHHLRVRHDRACAARGLATWRTPDVVTWAELLRRHFEFDRACGRTDARWLDAGNGRLVWEQLVRRHVERDAVLAPAGLGARAQRAWGLLHEYAIPRTALADDASPEVRAFGRWADEFERWLRQGGWLDPAQAACVVGAGEAGAVLRLVGFDRLTPLQQSTVDRFVTAGVDVVRVPAASREVRVPTTVACTDFDAEVETAARWAAARLERAPETRVALVVPGLARERVRVRRILDRVLVPAASLAGGPAPESTAYELAAATPLAERPVVAAALAWLGATVTEPDLETLSALLRSGFDGAADLEAVARAELDASLRRFEPFTRGLPRLARFAAGRAGCSDTAARLERVTARARGWHGARLPSRWAPEFAGTLQDLGWPGAVPGSAEHQAVQRWQALLAEFGASDDVAGPLQAEAAVGQLRALALDTAFEPQEIAAPLLVIDPETVAGMRFDAAWLCGLEAARWPAPAAPDPFLPRDWQVRQGVPGASAELAEAQARRVLASVCQSADETVCSVPQFEGEAPLLPSALVAGFAPAGNVAAWAGSTAAEACFSGRPMLETLVDGVLPAFAEGEVAKGGTRLLELQAACPFRAAVELRLGARRLEDAQTGLAATERGTVVHAVLQQVWHALRTQARLAAMDEDERQAWVAELVQAALVPLRNDADPVRLRLLDLEQRWLEARVQELLRQDLERPAFEVVHVEAPYTLDVGGVQVRLKLDRVDRLEDGSLAVIDYKTGAQARPAAWMGERPELPQLPLYVRAVDEGAVSAVAFGTVRKGATEYLGYARNPALFPQLVPFDANRRPFKEYGSWDELLETWQRRLDAIALEHAQGDARLAPDPARACRYCHLPALCRSAQATLEEEAADAGE